MTALALKRNLGMSYPTAWLLNQKINIAMIRGEATQLLGGPVQLDYAYLGGARGGGKPGRGSDNTTHFVAAVSMNNTDHPCCHRCGILGQFTFLRRTRKCYIH